MASKSPVASTKNGTISVVVRPDEVPEDPRLKELTPIIVVVGDQAFTAQPKTFSSGSYGWYGSAKLTIAGKPCQVGINLTVIGSKPAS